MSFLSRIAAPFFLAAVALLLQACSTAAGSHATTPQYVLVDRVVAGGPGGWDFITFDPIGHRLFIARSDRVQVWSAKSRQVIAEIPGTAGIHGVALAQTLNKGFTTNGSSNTMTGKVLENKAEGPNPD